MAYRWGIWSRQDHQLVPQMTNKHRWTLWCFEVVMYRGWQNKRHDLCDHQGLLPVFGEGFVVWSRQFHERWVCHSTQPSLRSRTSWANDIGTEHRERTVSFDTSSCHLTPSIICRHRSSNTFSLSQTYSVQNSRDNWHNQSKFHKQLYH